MLIAGVLSGPAHFRSMPYKLTLIGLFHSSIRVKPLWYLDTAALFVNLLSPCIVEVVGRNSHFYVTFVDTPSAIISIRVLLVMIVLLPVVHICLLLMFHRATLVMRCHVLSRITRRVCQLNAAIVVCLQA